MSNIIDFNKYTKKNTNIVDKKRRKCSGIERKKKIDLCKIKIIYLNNTPNFDRYVEQFKDIKEEIKKYIK